MGHGSCVMPHFTASTDVQGRRGKGRGTETVWVKLTMRWKCLESGVVG